MQPSEEDERTLAAAQSFVRFLQQLQASQPGVQPEALAPKLARELLPLLPELAPGIGRASQLFVQGLAQRVSERFASELRSTGST